MQDLGIDVKESNANFRDLVSHLSPAEQTMIVLVGIPGSGKSTFARRILEASRDDDEKIEGSWLSVCQDVLKSRQAVLAAADEHLHRGGCIIIDRCNFDKVQRKHWLDLAAKHSSRADKAVRTLCVVMPRAADKEFCAARAYKRGNDGVHTGEEDWDKVCGIMNSNFRAPRLEEEPFEGIWYGSEGDGDDEAINTELESIVQFLFANRKKNI